MFQGELRNSEEREYNFMIDSFCYCNFVQFTLSVEARVKFKLNNRHTFYIWVLYFYHFALK